MRRSFSKVRNKPAFIKQADDSHVYLVDGKRHRLDGPAVIHPNGIEEWYKEGKLHRDNGPAYRDPSRTYIAWYQNGVVHREDGPAIIEGTDRYWMQKGLMHREDGPALESLDGNQFWSHGIRYDSLADMKAHLNAQKLDAHGVPSIKKLQKVRPLYPKPPQ